MKLDDDIHLVMSGALGLDLTGSLDCNAYLVRAGEGWLMFDAGAGRGTAAVLDGLRREGIDPGRIRALFLTHGHADHSAGAAAVRAALGCPVMSGAATARMVSAGDEAAISLTAARAAGGYPSDFVYAGCPIERSVDDGERLAFDGATVTALATPGHSHDHMAYLVETDGRRILVSGDALFPGGKVSVQDIYDCSISAICGSIRRLGTLAFDTLLPGHGAPSLRNAQRHAEAAMAYVRRLACPPSIP
ncbi:MBL fold metallo-hydrolase [Labrys wisconsinensis]|uniref:Glyoxylase-like metal-dependent hydrolase (Beta-lactamase superfamily II) n=1 Tax=Labrys wisconsinensis TaxID=425677 RepID=A0ABU0JJC2_9HYPH|nr:MBL fold metallo-hydrolase [Labrys wisconsinensis]MDQ0474378.1 glyoxylase-like metal-dependent hydrolase (beta-lactamase superfamily II) [Labrys wisconsinensis]